MATLYYCPNCKNMRRAVFARGLCKNCNKQLNIDVTLSEKEWQNMSDSQKMTFLVHNRLVEKKNNKNLKTENIESSKKQPEATSIMPKLDVTDTIRKYKELYDIGAITSAEYEVKKKANIKALIWSGNML